VIKINQGDLKRGGKEYVKDRAPPPRHPGLDSTRYSGGKVGRETPHSCGLPYPNRSDFKERKKGTGRCFPPGRRDCGDKKFECTKGHCRSSG